MKIGVVDVGGGLRGVYAAGVLDYCMEAGIRFDVCIGVSAGSANLCSYLAGQKGRNFLFYTEYPFRKEYMSVRNLRTKHSYLDLNYVYGTLSNSDGENPLDFQTIQQNPAELIVVAANALTGEAKYFDKSYLKQDDYSILKASSAIPFACSPCEIDGIPYYDGALGDPVPLKKAFEMDCDKVVVLLSRPKSEFRIPGKDNLLADRIKRTYPVAAEKLRQRARQYNSGVSLALRHEYRGDVLIVAPEDTFGLGTLSRDKEDLKRLYEEGYHDGEAIPEFLR